MYTAYLQFIFNCRKGLYDTPGILYRARPDPYDGYRTSDSILFQHSTPTATLTEWSIICNQHSCPSIQVLNKLSSVLGHIVSHESLWTLLYSLSGNTALLHILEVEGILITRTGLGLDLDVCFWATFALELLGRGESKSRIISIIHLRPARSSLPATVIPSASLVLRYLAVVAARGS